MVTLLPVVLARDQLTTPFGGSMLVEQADIKDKIRATAKAMLIVLNVIPFFNSFLRLVSVRLAVSTIPYAFLSFN